MPGISASILTKNYTVRSAGENAQNHWTMNKYLKVYGVWDSGVICVAGANNATTFMHYSLY